MSSYNTRQEFDKNGKYKKHNVYIYDPNILIQVSTKCRPYRRPSTPSLSSVASPAASRFSHMACGRICVARARGRDDESKAVGPVLFDESLVRVSGISAYCMCI